MEIAAAAASLVNGTVRTSSTIWSLCESWKDAPKEVHHLRDTIDHTREFFSQVQQGIEKARLDKLSIHFDPLQNGSHRELELLLKQGSAVVTEIENIVLRVLHGKEHSATQGKNVDELSQGGGESSSLTPEVLRKRRRAVWMAKAATVARLRGVLKDTSRMVCANLISLNVYVHSHLFKHVGPGNSCSYTDV